MDRNLEKNLRKIQGLREKGQLEKALSQLESWAKKNPDTPHYQYEAANVALDLGDHVGGLRWLKNLLRSAPDSRARVLEAVNERFQNEPILPLGEFLIDRYLSRDEIEPALAVVTQLSEEDLEQYRQKLKIRHSGLASSSTPELLKFSLYAQIAVAHAQKNPEEFGAHAQELLAGQSEQAKPLAALCESELKLHPRCTPLLAAAGLAQLQTKQVERACQLLSTAAAPETAPALLEKLRDQRVPDEHRGAWLRTLAELALAARSFQEATEFFREAADANPKSRADILERLQNLPPSLDAEAAAPLWKLQLRLLVVMRKYGPVPSLIEKLRTEAKIDADELRAIMGEGQENSEAPAEMAFLLTEAALQAKDLAAAVQHTTEIPDRDEHVLHKVIRAIEKVLPEWTSEKRLELSALQAVIYARLGQQRGANETLAELWEKEEDASALFAVTKTCLQRVQPSARLLSAMLKPSLAAGQTELLSEALDGLLHYNPEDLKWTADDIVAQLDEMPEYSAALLSILDQADSELGATQLLRYPVACAALSCGRIARAVPEFQILLMARPQLAEEVLERLRRALQENPEDAELNLAAFDLLWEAQEHEEAEQCLVRALRAEPERIQELSDRFEQLLVDAPDSSSLWLGYGEALYSIGRFAQLDELVKRGLASKIDSSSLSDLRLLQARVLVDEGHVDDAVAHIELLLNEAEEPPEHAVGVLQGLLESDPGNARARYLLGRAGDADLDIAVPAFCKAADLDRNLVKQVATQLDALLARPAATATHFLLVANFDRRHRDPEVASRAYERALRLDSNTADKVLADLGGELESPSASLELLYTAAHAARHAGKLEQACQILTRLYGQNTAEIRHVLAELRKVSQEFPEELLPQRTSARILLADKQVEAAAELVASLATNPNYPVELRRAMLEEFQQRVPAHWGLLMGLAQFRGQDGDRDQAAELLWSALQHEDLDIEAALGVTRALLKDAPEQGELRLIQHDLLLRSGQVEAAYEALPQPSALPRERQNELNTRLSAASRRGFGHINFVLSQAESYRQEGRRDESLALLRQAYEKAEGEDRVRLGSELARGLKHVGRQDEAQEIFLGLVDEGLQWTQVYSLVGRWRVERLEQEGRALRQRIEENPDDCEARLQLGAILLQRDKVAEAADLLSETHAEGEPRLRRACLLADAYLRLDRCTRAEAVLHAVAGETEDFWAEEIEWRMAQCAQRMERHAECHARYEKLFDSKRYGERARERATEAYGRYLSDLAGEYRAVLSRVSTL
jgi:predicted Zn-dependent protease